MELTITQLRAAARQALKAPTTTNGVEATEKFSFIARMEDKAIRAKEDLKIDRFILQQRRLAEGYSK